MISLYSDSPVADPGFPAGGGGAPTTDVGTFGGNACKKERIGSRWGEAPADAPWIRQCSLHESANINHVIIMAWTFMT